MEQKQQDRGSFGSNFGFLMAAIGSAVGLGNIWGFPYKMGKCGGFAFLLVYLCLAIFVGLCVMVGEMALVLGGPYFDADTVPPPEAIAADFSNTQVLAKLLFTDYAYPFELASLILLVAMIAAVALTLRHRSGTRRQNAHRQIAVRASDRLVVHAMPAEVEEGERLSGDKTE